MSTIMDMVSQVAADAAKPAPAKKPTVKKDVEVEAPKAPKKPEAPEPACHADIDQIAAVKKASWNLTPLKALAHRYGDSPAGKYAKKLIKYHEANKEFKDGEKKSQEESSKAELARMERYKVRQTKVDTEKIRAQTEKSYVDLQRELALEKQNADPKKKKSDKKADSVNEARLTPKELVARVLEHTRLDSLNALQVIATKDKFLDAFGDQPCFFLEYQTGVGRPLLMRFLESVGIWKIENIEYLFALRADDSLPAAMAIPAGVGEDPGPTDPQPMLETPGTDVEVASDDEEPTTTDDLVTPKPEPRADALVFMHPTITLEDDPAVTKRAAGVLFIAPGGKVLVGMRAENGSEYQGYIGTFGGHHEEGESLELTAIREVLEETGHETEGQLHLIAQTLLDGTEFTYFANVCKKFDPILNEEHYNYQWIEMGEHPMGEPIPGLMEVINSDVMTELRKSTMHELHIAKAMAAGALPSPQKYANLSMYKMRVTGTGVAFRKGNEEVKDKDGKVIKKARKDEHVFRRPELYMNDDFLERCQGLLVIWQHPDKAVLDSDEFRDRVIGSLVCPFLDYDRKEVWGIAKVLDADAATLLDNTRLSTSPTVEFQDRTVNSTISLSDGSVLFIEGEPSLLDHLAVCEAGVWDKGQTPVGVISESAG